MPIPSNTKPIPQQAVNELAAFGPFYIKEFFNAEESSPITFSGAVDDGRPLPKGMICTADGFITGIPAKGTSGVYDIIITATNAEGEAQATFSLMINPALTDTSAAYLDQLKTQVWQALDKKMPVPDLSALYAQNVSVMDVYYLLERWATLIIWNASNLSPPGKANLIKLIDASPHYSVYDRGSCLVASPKDLYSHQRTLADALQTARAMAREIYKRDWIIEFAGFEKMVRAAWVEFQHLEDKFGKKMQILRYDPGFKELRIYSDEQREILAKRAEQP